MNQKLPQPRTIADFYALVPDEAVAEVIFVRLRWPDGVCCPCCGSYEMTRLESRRLWQCRACRVQSSIRSGYVMHRSKRSLRDWLFAAWRCSQPAGASARSIARELGSRYDSTWLMVQKIRAALAEREGWQLEGEALLGTAHIPAPKVANGDPPGQPPVLVAAVLDPRPSPPDPARYSVAAPEQTAEELQAEARYRHVHVLAEVHVEPTRIWPTDRLLAQAHRRIKLWLTQVFGGVSRRYMSNYLAQRAYVENRWHLRDELFGCVVRRLVTEPWRPQSDVALAAP